MLDTTAFELSDSWRRWIAENHLLGTDEQAILNTLISQGVSEDQARAELEKVRLDTHLVAGEWIVQRLRKLESLLASQEQMRRLDPAYAEVPRRSGITREQFLLEHYAANRPVVLTDVADHWAARRKWTAEFLTERVGNETVEVMTARHADDQYEQNLDMHRARMRFAEYIDLVMTSGPSNDFYLVANNHFFDNPGVSRLLEDFDFDARILDPDAWRSQLFFWFGPAGTVTPLHHDVSNVLLAQVTGAKCVTLVPALEAHRVYNEVGVFSPVDPESPNGVQHPLFADATRITVDLREGEALFIPVGWWHHVRSLDVSVSISFTNFVFPNDFQWAFPDIDRR
ncbi:cupin-like domain-containing protein [Streptomyces sp. NPDC056061]|uniref:cupin-like domain-containing protein n=1 Tax=Streptomyces sp. NPDC056061 TaxID=3345700 RepID=UPI0035E29A61